MNRIRALESEGQSIWFDFIQRDLIWTGELHRMVVEDGLKGVTSNPSIFQKAIGGSQAYGPAVKAVVDAGATPSEVFEDLAVQDIQLACDVLRPVYDKSEAKDGYVSLEVSPHLAHDTHETVNQAMELWSLVGRENLMIKVPGTDAGLPAIEQLIGQGINVNVTLLFSVARYVEVAEAYMNGLESYGRQGGNLSQVASVASFFVSRIDGKIDPQIDQRIAQASGDEKAKLEALKGKVAIANAKVAYRSYGELIASDRWKMLEGEGAQPQRLLWASTSAKNPAYRDVVYIEELIGPDTVNTVPAATYKAFLDHGEAKSTLTKEVDEAEATLKTLAEADISLDTVTDTLVAEGVAQFAKAYDGLMGTVEARRVALLDDRLPRVMESLGGAQDAVSARLKALDEDRFVQRLWAKDGRLFAADPKAQASAAQCMGWLDSVQVMLSQVSHLIELQEEIEDQDFEQILLMGMGGSSLAPEVFRRTFGQLDGSPELLVLDSTVPAQVRTVEKEVEASEKTLFITASKSGSTTEPLAFDSFFWDQVRDGNYFMAITDPGSHLETDALRRDFASIFNGHPEIGGRYSALSPFGLVPAAAMGLDIVDLLQRATLMVGSCEAAVPAAQNAGVRLGAILGELALHGRDKLTFVMSPYISSLGGWLEQLVAESTGKEGRGIVPVDKETLGTPAQYGEDRVFVSIEVEGDPVEDADEKLAALEAAGHPVLRILLGESDDLVQEMFRWEVATATAGHIMGINPFDQPNVQESKDYTKKLLTEARENQRDTIEVEGEVKLLEEGGVTVYTDANNAEALKKASLADIVKAHLGRVKAGDYVAFNAYVEMNEEHAALLQKLRHLVRDAHQVATTVGFGPRFLHSTGQLHKGGANNGVFFQITCDDPEDLTVPGMDLGFSLLKKAQEAGDFLALSSRDRRLLRVHLGANVTDGLEVLVRALGE